MRVGDEALAAVQYPYKQNGDHKSVIGKRCGKVTREEYECPLALSLELIGGKWKTLLLYHLRKGPLRTGEIKRRLPDITQKMLTQQIRDLVLQLYNS
jgi:DNA-binding HxlR family transcriptional regulator